MAKSPYIYTEEHRKFCTTDRQEEFLNLALAGNSTLQISKILDILMCNASKIGQRIRHQAIRNGYNPNARSAGLLSTPIEDLPVKGKSTYYQEDPETGEVRPVAGWVKTDKTSEQMIADARIICSAMSEEIPPLAPVPVLPEWRNSDLLNLHVLTDIHIGMYAWKEETGGDNWSTDLAKEFILKWFRHSISKAPNAKYGMLAQLGDLFHQDGLEPVTPAHRHILDSDTRWQEVVRTGIYILRQIVSMMLEKYEVVCINSLSGNHDESTGGEMREMLSALYENEPRVIVDRSPSVYQAFEFGNVCLFMHHGHKRAVKNIDHVLVGKYKEMFGRSKFTYAHLGHRHCKEVYESNLMIVEQHSTMAPPDAYAASAGYMSSRGAEVITYHKQYGEVGRQRTSPVMLLNRDKNTKD